MIYRRFDVHVGACGDCGGTVQGRHELQTSIARGAAASQFGPRLHAGLALLNKQLGLSHGKSVKLLGTLFEGLSMSRGTSARSVPRSAKRCGAAQEQLRQGLWGASEVAPDETGWRVGGRSTWLHAFVSERSTVYEIDPTRGHEPIARLLGMDWPGTLVHDGWSVYDRFTRAAHQQCLRHLQRRCQELLAAACRDSSGKAIVPMPTTSKPGNVDGNLPLVQNVPGRSIFPSTFNNCCWTGVFILATSVREAPAATGGTRHRIP
jgi:transposase